MKKFSSRTIFAFVCVFCTFLMFRPSLALSSARDGVYLCLYTLIPTLFPFFVISRLLISYITPSNRIGNLFSRLFGVSPSLLSAYIIGLISGFPAGGAAVAQVYENGFCSREEAERALGFCNNTGPAFAVGAVGALLGNVKFAAVIYFLQIPSSLITSRLLPPTKATHKAPEKALSEVSLPSAVKDSMLPMASVCAFVIFFSPLLAFIRALLETLGAPTEVSAVILALTELSGGIRYACTFLPLTGAFILCAFACGWSGLSVILQLRTLTGESGLRIKYCVIGKFIQGCVCLLSAIVYLGIEKLFSM